VGRRAGRAGLERGLDRGAAFGEARTVEKAVLVEGLRDPADAIGVEELAVPPQDDFLDLPDGVLAVEPIETMSRTGSGRTTTAWA
jgi:hypothetical protein